MLVVKMANVERKVLMSQKKKKNTESGVVYANARNRDF
jgi:hypothetical protein